jgi:hypothetical protein
MSTIMQRMRDVHESRKQPKKWMMFSKIWSCFSETQDLDESNTIKLNHVFANRSKKDEIFPLTVKEIEVAQKSDPILTYLFKSNAVLSKGLRTSTC